jgi:hypothetical protein
MLFASIPDLLKVPQAIEVFERLGYPIYLLQFVGIAKILGVVVLLSRVPARIKEWAYVGFTIDSIGAVYSHVVVGDAFIQWWGAALALVLSSASFWLFLLTNRREPSRSVSSVSV